VRRQWGVLAAFDAWRSSPAWDRDSPVGKRGGPLVDRVRLAVSDLPADTDLSHLHPRRRATAQRVAAELPRARGHHVRSDRTTALPRHVALTRHPPSPDLDRPRTIARPGPHAQLVIVSLAHPPSWLSAVPKP
jgi:hypothetical protein